MKKALLTVFALLLCFAMVFSFAGCSGMEEDETTTTIKVKSILPTEITTSYDEESRVVTDTTYSPEAQAQNTKTIFEYFDIHINEVKFAKAAVSQSQKKSIGKVTDENGESIAMSENKYINAAISALDSYMLHSSSSSTEYGDDLTDFMPVKGESFVSSLTIDDVEKATCVDEGETRKINLTLKSPALPETIEKAYNMGDVNEALNEFKKSEKYLTISTPVLTYNNCQINITVNIQTDEVTEIEYIKNIDVSVEATGHDSLSDIGTVPVKFRYTDTVKYSINREEPTTLAEK